MLTFPRAPLADTQGGVHVAATACAPSCSLLKKPLVADGDNYESSFHGHLDRSEASRSPSDLAPGEEALCICAVCERSWVEHGEPDESHWEWRKLELAEAVAEAPWGIFDPSWFYELHKLSVSEIAVFLAFVAYRNGNSGESAPSLATVFALTGVSRRWIYRCIAKLWRSDF